MMFVCCFQKDFPTRLVFVRCYDYEYICVLGGGGVNVGGKDASSFG